MSPRESPVVLFDGLRLAGAGFGSSSCRVDALEWASEVGKLSETLASDYRLIASAALSPILNHVIGFPIANETLNASRRVVQGIQKIIARRVRFDVGRTGSGGVRRHDFYNVRKSMH